MSTFHGVGVWPGAELKGPAAVDLARQADRAGLHSVWFSEAYYGRDGVSLLAASAMVTERIKLATGVVNPYTRHPCLLTMSYATMAELAPGRVIFGLGSSEKNWIEDMGYDFRRPRTIVAETLEVFDQLYSRKPVDYQGKEVVARNARMMFRELPNRPSVVLAAVGPRMCELARDASDGVLLSIGGPALPELVRRRLGDVPESFLVGMTIPMAIGDDEEALGHVRPTVTALLAVPEGEAILAMSGHDPDYAGHLRGQIAELGFRRAAREVPASLVREFAVVGPREVCRERIAEFVRAGVTLPIMQVGAVDHEEAVAALADIQRDLAADTEPTGTEAAR